MIIEKIDPATVSIAVEYFGWQPIPYRIVVVKPTTAAPTIGARRHLSWIWLRSIRRV